MALAPGARLGPYEIVGRLGAGGMGEVYRARDPRLGREVAVKVLPQAFGEDSERLARFRREARLASSLNHPNIVIIHDVGECDGLHYITMELVEGQTLADMFRHPPHRLQTIVDVAAQVADALACLHEAGIVHRDVKPSNVIVTSGLTAKLLDFGLGRHVRAPAGEGSPDSSTHGGEDTSPGMLLGTASYMSPEQARGQPADFRSDQFSFGVLLYEWLARRHPFERPSPVETLSAVISSPAERLSSTNADVPEALELVVERCLSKDPSGRFASTADLARALKDIAAHLKSGRKLAAVPAARRRLPLWRIATFVTAVAAVAAAAVVGWMWPYGEGAAPVGTQVAVLPFTNVGGDPANDVLTDGLVELLTSRLTQLERTSGRLWVVPASEVRQQRVTSAREALQAFNVNTVVTGSVQRTADRVRLTLNVIDPQTMRQVGADTVDARADEVSVLQDDVVLRLLRLLALDVGTNEREALAAGGTSTPAAYEYYLQGRGYLRRQGEANLRLALDRFSLAREADPKYGLAHAAIAETSWRLFEATKDVSWVDRAREAADRAIALSPELMSARVTLALIATGTGRYEEAVATLRVVLAQDPANADAHRELARAYDALGDASAAEATYRQAIAARPGDWLAHNALGVFYFRVRRYADAAREFERVVALAPDNPRGHTNLGSALATLGRHDQAVAALERATALSPTGNNLSNLGTAYYRQGRYSEAIAAIERAIAAGAVTHRVWFNLASACRWLPGSEARAREAFERAIELGEQERAVNPRQPALLGRLAKSYAALDRRDPAVALIAEAEAMAPADPQVLLDAASVYEDLGNRRLAIERLKAAFAAGATEIDVRGTRLIERVRADPAFAGPRARP